MATEQAANPRKKPWALAGREAEIIEIREVKHMTFEQMGVHLEVTTEGARSAYHRAKQKQETPTGTSGEGS